MRVIVSGYGVTVSVWLGYDRVALVEARSKRLKRRKNIIRCRSFCPLAEPAKCVALTIIMQPLQTSFNLCKPGWSLRKEYFELVAVECTFLLLRSNLPATAVSLIDLHHLRRC